MSLYIDEIIDEALQDIVSTNDIEEKEFWEKVITIANVNIDDINNEEDDE